MPVANPHVSGPTTVEVVKTEEKGSDVSLASYLLLDGFHRDYETAVIVSNDSDLVTPIELVQEDLGFLVGVLNPHKNTSWALRNAASFYRRIRKGPLSVSQFPPALSDSKGRIMKPRSW